MWETQLTFTRMVFDCRTKSVAALGTTFGLLLLLLSVISKFVVNSISSYCNYSQFCLYLALFSMWRSICADTVEMTLKLDNYHFKKKGSNSSTEIPDEAPVPHIADMIF